MQDLFSHEVPIFTEKLTPKLHKNLKINFPKESQIYGAVMEAAKNAGIETDEAFLRNYNNTVDAPLLESSSGGYIK